MGGTPLQNFDHPKDAIYILGAEDSVSHFVYMQILSK